MKRVIVAGGAGFLGMNLCSTLLRKGYEVTCVDDLSSGRKSNVAENAKNSNFMFIDANIITWDPCNLTEFDFLFNLASRASPPDYQTSRVNTIESNTIGSINLLTRCAEIGAGYLYASTSEVYGNPLEYPQREDYFGNVNPFGERSCYDEGKRCGEAIAYAFMKEHGVDVRVARIFNTYGPGMRPDDGRVVSNMITQALAGRDLTVYGAGGQVRSFCYVTDTIEGLILMMECKTASGLVINIGNPTETTIISLAKKILRLTGSTSKIVNRPLPMDDPSLRCPDITRAKAVLDWEPKVELEDGLIRTINYFKR